MLLKDISAQSYSYNCMSTSCHEIAFSVSYFVILEHLEQLQLFEYTYLAPAMGRYSR